VVLTVSEIGFPFCVIILRMHVQLTKLSFLRNCCLTTGFALNNSTRNRRTIVSEVGLSLGRVQVTASYDTVGKQTKQFHLSLYLTVL